VTLLGAENEEPHRRGGTDRDARLAPRIEESAASLTVRDCEPAVLRVGREGVYAGVRAVKV